MTLASLRGLRTAPDLEPTQRRWLRQQLEQVMAGCRWFTIGVMAPSAAAALSTLRAVEQAGGWDALELDPAGEALETIEGPVFLKGNQNTGRFLVRREAGLGEGLLITGHNPEAVDREDTWGPLPLNLFH